MRISDQKKFAKRVMYPLAFIFFAMSLFVGTMTSVVVGGQPITLIVAVVFLMLGAFALEDASDRNNGRK